ncbi:MAG: polyprotein [Plantago potyvirus 1]|nr:MAG: polyprotein [Plantago potyvirus 1]
MASITQVSTIMFGSFEVPLAPPAIQSVAQPKPLPIFTIYKKLGDRMISDYEKSVSVLDQVEEKCKEHLAQLRASFVKQSGKTSACYTLLKPRKIKRVAAKRVWVEKPYQFKPSDSIITSLSIAGGTRPSMIVEPLKERPTYSRRERKIKRTPRVYDSPANLDILKHALCKFAKRGGVIEVIDRKKVKPARARGTRCLGKPALQLHLPHHDGKKIKRELVLSQFQQAMLIPIAHHITKGVVQADHLTRGSSGIILNPAKVVGNIGCHEEGYFVVRGRLAGRLLSATSNLSHDSVCTLEHYSVADEFWEGFNRKFQASRRIKFEHQCTRHITPTVAGEIAAIVCQGFFPCQRITCYDCPRELANENEEKRAKLLELTTNASIEELKTHYGGTEHIVQILTQLADSLTFRNPSIEECGEIRRLTGGRKDGPFAHIAGINENLMPRAQLTSKNISVITKHLKELARWHMNRTESIKAGSLETFRNKISAKAHVNTTLMCDNMRDQDGNFVWALRGYHSKRLIDNYFHVVKGGEDYSKFAIRMNRNGQRKIAIERLLVPTDFRALRAHNKGEDIEKLPIGRCCFSLKDGNYAYSVSCVTLDDGRPKYSEMKLPTKNHLVIGNAGDNKYVDLPKGEDLELYITKDGFCYVNIFLAMLVEVDEKDAKDFTKKARDLAVEKLGPWPKMIDLATACYMLAHFFPGVQKAELPRILVDHKDKTMHVIDSYGSITTGYHILKANTVDQLIQFADDTLDGEMKMYEVGGLNRSELDGMSAIKLLIQGVFRPRLMEELLLHEPYILVQSLLSPTVLVALYNNGSLEQLAKRWINTRQSIAHTAALLSNLAQRVSVAETLYEQIHHIERDCPDIHRVMLDGVFIGHSYLAALELLSVIQNRSDSNAELDSVGYRPYDLSSLKLIEKNYQQLLEESWADLSLREKLSQIYAYHRYSLSGRRLLEPVPTRDSNVILNKSPSRLLQHLRIKAQKRGSNMYNRIHEMRRICSNKVRKLICDTTNWLVPDVVKLINVLIVVSLMLTVVKTCNDFLVERKQQQMQIAANEHNAKVLAVMALYNQLKRSDGMEPTKEDFLEFVEEQDEKLLGEARALSGEVVHFQGKSKEEATLEKVVAFAALLAMMFDTERSDAVFRILSKLKTVLTTTGQEVFFQSLDDIRDIESEKKLTIDFILDSEEKTQEAVMDMTFSKWWSVQMNEGRTIPHYRTVGHFIEFTRASATEVCNKIANDHEHNEFIIRGAVGSGKSTGLPFGLAKKGQVLMLEPTRPLAMNVAAQLRGAPFYATPNLRMRGLSTFGSAAIDIMTSGYALHYFANNQSLLQSYHFIILDECHVLDEHAMAFVSLLKDTDCKAKLLKVSATPPGRECEFSTQKPVTVNTADSLSFDQFVSEQFSGSNVDVTNHGDNILVYVASYNEVDQLSAALGKKGFLVSKVDGRTMKNGTTEIATKGSPDRKHFIVATNIIENGVTLDIDVVVDFGTKVKPELDLDMRTIRYTKIPVSYGERIQRLGRVGRLKPGHALRIGHTNKGLVEIPQMIATGAAFLCFIYGLPVMTNNVDTSLLGGCTGRQARAMQNFELSPYFTAPLVRYDGSMHPEIHKLLKPYKLRDSDMMLSALAIPNEGVSSWITAKSYKTYGSRIELADEVRIPFLEKGIPERLYEEVWKCVCTYKKEAGFGQLKLDCATKVAFTLKIDIHSIPRTIGILDQLIAEEQKKQSYFRAMNGSVNSFGGFTLSGIVSMIRQRYQADHTEENIERLQRAKAQVLEYNQLAADPDALELIQNHGALRCVLFQSKQGVSKALNLKGHWRGSLATRDLFISGITLLGGSAMIYNYFVTKWREPVFFQGQKRQKQKLRFRQARDRKLGTEVYSTDGAVETLFGEAYEKKGRKTGKTHGLGKKSRKFVNMYGFDPSEYTFIRFLDPLTGATLDESSMHTDIALVQEHFGNIRKEQIDSDLLDKQRVVSQPGIEAYYVKDGAKAALKVDLTPHNPLLFSRSAVTIAGFPEREDELRQTGAAKLVASSVVPTPNVMEPVYAEAKTALSGPRDYNPIAKNVCKVVNVSDGNTTTLFCLGFGSILIANKHLFRRNNGTMMVYTHNGDFKIPNTCDLRMKEVADRDIVLIRMPKDFAPLSSRLKFRKPQSTDKVVLVGSNFQEKYVSSTVSETSVISEEPSSTFWKYWITTYDGTCGTPVVSVKDGFILGLHSLSSGASSHNFFTSFPENFHKDYLSAPEDIQWRKCWKFDPRSIAWGSLDLFDSRAEAEFNAAKRVVPLNTEPVFEQGMNTSAAWLERVLHGNLKAVAKSNSALVTKHVVRGKCPLFQTYLSVNPEAFGFFKELLSHYQKSRLNKEAYVKDLLKYSSPVTVGVVDTDAFEVAQSRVIDLMRNVGFSQCEYVTDEQTILDALNKKAAVGALFSGKKKEYLESYTTEEQHALVRLSCERLFKGKLGVWNGALKAEIRPVEKVLANKTRSFTAAPIDTLLGGKVCVDDFNNQFYSLHTKAPWSVGMTKFYGGWDKLLTQLPDDWIYCDADGSQFDSSLSPYLINAILALRMQFMEDWDVGRVMLQHLYEEIVYTPILAPDGTLVKKFKGNNSGQPSTVVDNTLMVLHALQYSLERNNITAEQEREVIRYYINGDDLIIAVRPDLEHILNTFSGYFGELGLNYDFTSRCTDKSQLWFMSHQGVKRDGIFIPKLEKERITAILEWDRSEKPEHRLEAICAALIEAWGYDDMVQEIRKFYLWVLEQEPYKTLSAKGHAPFLSELALRNLYMNKEPSESELEVYYKSYTEERASVEDTSVYFQSEVIDAGKGGDTNTQKKDKSQKEGKKESGTTSGPIIDGSGTKDKDVGPSEGTIEIPRLKLMSSKMRMPMVRGKGIINVSHLLKYQPDQVDISNSRATHEEFENWYERVKEDYGVGDSDMQILMNGLMVWCLENGTSPNMNGVWTMMDGSTQVSYPLKPVIEFAQPSLRQIMRHFSDAAEAYITMRNSKEIYMPRYGRQRNLQDRSLARYAFDFYEVTSRTPLRALEIHMQMKSAAVRGTETKLLGLDGRVGSTTVNTERHTSDDVTANVHSMLGVRNM